MPKNALHNPQVMKSAGRVVTAAVSTGAALVSILAFARSYGLIGTPQEAHLALGGFGVAWVGLTPAADTASSIGDTLQLAATAKDSHGSTLVGASITWASDDPNVATVDQSGSVITRGAGSTVIVVTVGERAARARIVVRQQPVGVRIEGDGALRVGEDEHRRLHAYPVDARGHVIAGRAVAWRSADTSIVAVDSTGTVTGRAAGRATLAATVEGVTGEAPIQVVAVPEHLEVVSGADQRVPAGGKLPQPVIARVISARGQPVPQTPVRLTVADGMGHVEPAEATTDDDGKVRAWWTLGDHAGRQRLLLRAEPADSALVVVAEADPVVANTRGAPIDAGQTAVVGESLRQPVGVRLTDSLGRALVDVPVLWTVPDGGAIVALSSRTDSLGEARANWRLGTRAGVQRARVQIGSGRSVAPLVVEARALAGPPVAAKFINGDSPRGPVATALKAPLILRVTDSVGNRVPDAAVTIAPATGSVPDSSILTDSTGQATVRWTLGRSAGAQKLEVRVAGIERPIVASARAVPRAPANIVFDSVRGSAAAGKRLPAPVSVTVTDAFGNPVPDTPVRFTARAGTVTPAATVTDAKGRATTRWTLGKVAGEQRLAAATGDDARATLSVEAEAAKSTAPLARTVAPAAGSAAKPATATKAGSKPSTKPAKKPAAAPTRKPSRSSSKTSAR
jgi:type IV secretory pathway protease TraF